MRFECFIFGNMTHQTVTETPPSVVQLKISGEIFKII